jgi:hypothetical protein
VVMLKRTFSLLTLITSLIACSGGRSSEQLQAASALLDTSERCLFSVRDQGSRYEESSSCNALSALADVYMNAGGFEPNSSKEANLKFEQARLQAWMALALSESPRRPLKIW